MKLGKNIDFLLNWHDRNKMMDLVKKGLKTFVRDYVVQLYPFNTEISIKISIEHAIYEKK